MPTNLRKQALKGTIWTSTSAAVRALIQLLRLAILTRFLEKSDFGLVAIVLLVVGLGHTFTDLGVSTSLFSTQEISKKQYSSLYWVSMLLSILLYLVLIALTPLVSRFYHLGELNQLIPVMGLELIFASMGRQFRVFREKALEFRTLAVIDIISLLCSLIVAYLLAIQRAGVYSLIISALFTSFSAGLMLVITGLSKHPLMFYINIREDKHFYKIGFYQTGSQLLEYLASQIDILLIGKFISVSELGIYNLIKQLVQKIALMVNPVVTGVAIPVLAMFQQDLDRLKEKYLQTNHAISFVNFGIYGLLALIGPEVLYFVYGPSYASYSVILQVLCIWGVFISLGNAASSIVVIRGRTDLGFKNTMLRVLLNPIFVITGSIYGILGIIISQALFAILFFGLNWPMVIAPILKGLSFRRYLNTFLPFFGFSVFVFGGLYVCKRVYDPAQADLWLCLCLWTPAFVLLYCLLAKKTFLKFMYYFR